LQRTVDSSWTALTTKIKSLRAFENSVGSYLSMQHNIPEISIFKQHYCEEFKFELGGLYEQEVTYCSVP